MRTLEVFGGARNVLGFFKGIYSMDYIGSSCQSDRFECSAVSIHHSNDRKAGYFPR